MNVGHNHLFNFSASHTGGGLKRLEGYAAWLDANGGAAFIIHPRCRHLEREFPANRYFVVHQPPYRRIFNDTAYLGEITAETGMPELYYAYGIPIYSRIGRVNWFHLSNILPIYSAGIPRSLFDRARFGILGWKIRRNFRNADIISAESESSLSHIRVPDRRRLFLSVNGSDDELAAARMAETDSVEDAAVVVGTYRYKALDESGKVFDMLKRNGEHLTLVIIGDDRKVSGLLRSRPDVRVTGPLPRSEVVEHLRTARYYISTTLIENSYNAAAEGLFLAQESYLSDIGPHRELLRGVPFDLMPIPNSKRSVIHVRRADALPSNLKSWAEVVTEMLERCNSR